MKSLIFIRGTVFLSGLMFTMACQNAKLGKNNPPSTSVPAGPGSQMPPGQQQMPPGQQGQQMPPGRQGGQQMAPPVYPPPVDRSGGSDRYATQSIPERPLGDEKRTGPMPTNPVRQTGQTSPVRDVPQIVPWFEKTGPYEKVVENCGNQCPPATAKPPCTRPDCNVETRPDTGAALPSNQVLNTPQIIVPDPDVMNKATPQIVEPPPSSEKMDTRQSRSKEGDIQQDEQECPPFSLQKKEIVQDLDLVFIVDNSASMLSDRQKVAAGIGHFVENLGFDKNIRVAVVPGNGPKGAGYAQVVGNAVNFQDLVKSMGQQNAVTSLSNQLKQTMSNMPIDNSNTQGEAGLNATLALVDPDQPYLNMAKQQGLFSEKAAAMFVYISDENDVCYEYEKMGIVPNYVFPGDDKGMQGPVGDGIGRDPFEAQAFKENGVCKNIGRRKENLTPKVVYEALQNLKAGQPVILSGILYTNNEKDSKGKLKGASGDYEFEKEMGRGYLDLIGLNNIIGSKSIDFRSMAFDLRDPNFGQHLAKMANNARGRMEFETVLTMSLPKGTDVSRIDQHSIRVVVKKANGDVLKEFKTICSVQKCDADIGTATYLPPDPKNAAPRVAIAPEIAKDLTAGSKAIIYYKLR